MPPSRAFAVFADGVPGMGAPEFLRRRNPVVKLREWHRASMLDVVIYWGYIVNVKTNFVLTFTPRRARAAKRLISFRARSHPPKAAIVNGKYMSFTIGLLSMHVQSLSLSRSLLICFLKVKSRLNPAPGIYKILKSAIIEMYSSLRRWEPPTAVRREASRRMVQVRRPGPWGILPEQRTEPACRRQ